MNKKNIAILCATGVSVLLPLVAFAQVSVAGNACANNTYYEGLERIICQIYRIIKIIIPVLILGAVAYFIYGVIKFVIAGDAEEKTEGRSMMIYGVIGFAVIVGLWGLVNILLSTFNLDSATPVPLLPGF